MGMVMVILVWCDTYMYVNPEGGGEAARENPIDDALGSQLFSSKILPTPQQPAIG